tara:strand:+ start:19257 stop:19481 length:225 start_codon:yes stop_codon:yes gene_type:complete
MNESSVATMRTVDEDDSMDANDRSIGRESVDGRARSSSHPPIGRVIINPIHHRHSNRCIVDGFFRHPRVTPGSF